MKKTMILLALPLWTSWAAAQGNAEAGKVLHAQKCAACHDAKVATGGGDVLYTRSDRKVRSLQKLKAQVAMCNSELRLDLFPEDEADLVAWLNQQFYKFK